MNPPLLLLLAALGAGLTLLVSVWLLPQRRVRVQGTSALRHRLDAAGMPKVSIATFAVVSLVASLSAGGAAFGLSGVLGLGVAAAIAGILVPRLVVSSRVTRRTRALDRVWPDIVDRILSALRSGATVPQALGTLAHDGPPLLREPFEQFRQSYAATGSFAQSIEGLRSDIAHPSADRLCTLLHISHQGGGSHTVRVLTALAQQLRAELATRGELIARQSWITNAARLGIAAPWVVLVVLGSREEARAAFNTPGGLALIAIGVAACASAYMLMRRLARLPQETRWAA